LREDAPTSRTLLKSQANTVDSHGSFATAKRRLPLGAGAQLIGIVGGGISGLVLAHELVGLGADVVLWESADRPGGVLWSRECGGLQVELGPQRARLTTAFRELVDDLGLADELVTAPVDLPLFVYTRGKLRVAPLTLGQAVFTDLLPLSSKVRILSEPFRPGPGADETAGAFLRRKFGEAAYRDMLGPLYGGLYGSDPDHMPARHGLARTLKSMGVGRSILWRMIRAGGQADEAPPCSFRDGLAVLPRALQARLGDRVHTETPVRSVEQIGSGWEVVLDGDQRVPVDHVVITCPADQAAKIVERASPDAAEILAEIRYNPLAVVHMRSGADLRGLGYQHAFGEPFETRGVTWNHSLFGRSGLYTAYLGGMKNPAMVDRPDEEIGRIACQEFETVTGHSAETLMVSQTRMPALMVSRTRMPAWDRSWDRLPDLDLPSGLHLCSNYSARPGIAGRMVEAQRLAKRLTAS